MFLKPKAHPKGGELVLARKHREEDIEIEKGKMSVAEAGRKGGAKGGPRVRQLIREGKEYEEEWE